MIPYEVQFNTICFHFNFVLLTTDIVTKQLYRNSDIDLDLFLMYKPEIMVAREKLPETA